MDYTEVLQPIFNILWYMTPLVILAAVIKLLWFKGKSGETVVNLSAKPLLDNIRNQLSKNVTLPTEEGSTQIDDIIPSRYGVFLVETNNMKGWIFGDGMQRYWIWNIFEHFQKFQNPLHRKYKHLKALQSLLALSDEQLYSLRMFVGD